MEAASASLLERGGGLSSIQLRYFDEGNARGLQHLQEAGFWKFGKGQFLASRNVDVFSGIGCAGHPQLVQEQAVGMRADEHPTRLKYAVVIQAGQGRVSLGVGQRKPFAPQQPQRSRGGFGFGDGQPQSLGHRIRFGRPDGAGQVTLPLLAVAIVELVGVKAKPSRIAALQHAPGRADKDLGLPAGVVFQVGEQHHQGWEMGAVQRGHRKFTSYPSNRKRSGYAKCSSRAVKLRNRKYA
jgi:hypothetical protein